MKIGVIGATGMVGYVLFHELQKKNIDVIGIGRRKAEKEIVKFDLFTEWEQIKIFLQNEKFDIIINCSAILVNESNINRIQAVYINAFLPHLLVDTFKSSNTKLIHLSTGGVFSGQDECYFEDSYGITKAAGEFFNEKDLVIRSDFWGPDNKKNGTGIFNWFLKQKGEISAYTNVFFNGISNVEFARVAVDLLSYSGIIHLGVNEAIAKGILLEKIKKVFNLTSVECIPDNSIHKTVNLQSRKCLVALKNYDEMIDDIYRYILDHKDIYIDNYPHLYN